ncbi:MAG: dihydrolipoamide acetyltransferase family protein [Sphingobium sp.]
MAHELKMPALSPTMEKGTLAKWLVKPGDMVKPGDLLAEIETDKATMELEAPDAGRIADLLVSEGTDDVAVGTVIALLAEDGETSQLPAREAADRPTVVPESVLPHQAVEVVQRLRRSPSDRVTVSPLALRIAAAKGIDLSDITGTGPNGRIVRADLGIAPLVDRQPVAQARSPATRVPLPSWSDDSELPLAPPPAGVPVETVRLSSMRKTIARRLTESKRTVPHFYLTIRCNLDPLSQLRGELNGQLADRGVKLSINDLLIKAMACAMAQVPDVNVQFGGDELHRFGHVDIAMAVAVDGGLVTPVVRDVGSLSLSAIARQSKHLATKARDGKLLPEDYQGGTASISNLGMFGVDEMFPVINPPQALILGIGAGVRQPWCVDGDIALAAIMAVTASFDHRAIDGAAAARFMSAFRDLVETPLRICG